MTLLWTFKIHALVYARVQLNSFLHKGVINSIIYTTLLYSNGNSMEVQKQNYDWKMRWNSRKKFFGFYFQWWKSICTAFHTFEKLWKMLESYTLSKYVTLFHTLLHMLWNPGIGYSIQIVLLHWIYMTVKIFAKMYLIFVTVLHYSIYVSPLHFSSAYNLWKRESIKFNYLVTELYSSAATQT